MKIANTKSELNELIAELKLEKESSSVGFVPTMGALHQGHLSLIQKASNSCGIVVVSIFVNPTQFNNEDDLKKYPRTIEEDKSLLASTLCDLLFYPEVAEVYPKDYSAPKVDLIGLDLVMEGAFRPGHFEGVVNVVNRLFELVQPDMAFFGKKDFQQLAIIRKMVEQLTWNIEIVAVDIKRSESGLALSSRNARLSRQQQQEALIIYKTLNYGYELSKTESNCARIKAQMISFFEKGSLNLEYLEVANSKSLKPALSTNEPIVCCIAAHCGEVRLIDNMEFTTD